MTLSALFSEFFRSERRGGIILLVCTLISLALANSPLGQAYLAFWQNRPGSPLSPWGLDLSVVHWVNDGLMTLFFLLIGLEIERELYMGELRDFRSALLPLFAALGGMIVPAALYWALNAGTATASGFGIPMATDIAFSLGALALLGSRVPSSLKVFLTALAIIDDLGAVIVIGVFYTHTLLLYYLAGAAALFLLLRLVNFWRVRVLALYIAGGVLMWYCMMQSGIHPTVAGVLLAFAVPFEDGEEHSPSTRLQRLLHKPVAYGVLPLFALANTCIPLAQGWYASFLERNSLGIAAGLVLGKPAGIFCSSILAVRTGLCRKPDDISWRALFGGGVLAGIGFTMSLFVCTLAFKDAHLINSSVIAVLSSSALAAIAGLFVLSRPAAPAPLHERRPPS
ncbi:MAG TPA: Na+/H+ antiporter NhaA [Bacteroidota bacterium]|nr:Na+/H+ antiporter NhaA [Bacteroidota bacterium]